MLSSKVTGLKKAMCPFEMPKVTFLLCIMSLYLQMIEAKIRCPHHTNAAGSRQLNLINKQLTWNSVKP